jgi:predicted nucleotidyltransferase
MSDLSRLASTLNTSERTLRRAAGVGLLKADRVSERRLRVPDAERRYLESRWSLLAGLRAALRTEPNVELAVLFGSAARGTDGEGSDLDILVGVRDPDRFRVLELQDRLAQALGRKVDVVRLADAERSPWLMAEILTEGRVLVDRVGRWPAMAARAGRVRKRWRRAIVEHLEDLQRQLEALRYATHLFGDDFDERRFADAFESDDPERYMPVQAIERGFGRVQNYIAQLAQDGAKLAGLDVRSPQDGEPRAQPAFEALRDDGALTKDLCRRLVASQRSRSLFEHDYVRVSARDVHAAVTRLLDVAPQFLDRYATWIEPHLLPAS